MTKRNVILLIKKRRKEKQQAENLYRTLTNNRMLTFNDGVAHWDKVGVITHG